VGELREDLVGRPELLFYDGAGSHRVGRCRLILQSGQLRGHSPRDELGLRGHGLAELHEQSAGILERRAQRAAGPGTSYLGGVATRMEQAVPDPIMLTWPYWMVRPVRRRIPRMGCGMPRSRRPARGLEMSSTSTTVSMANTVTRA
jgi:hypothetical protein